MVKPNTPSTKRNIRRRQRNKNTDILVVVAVTIISVGLAWLFALRLINKQDTKVQQHHSFAAPHLLKEDSDNEDTTITTDNMNSISAKHMLPYIIYGTAWKKDETSSLVYQAIDKGFRFIDTACQPKHYNEPQVGLGIRTAMDAIGLSREDVFIQTKFTSLDGQDPNNTPYEKDAKLEDQVRQSVQASLRNLQVDYIDSVLLHSPMRTDEETLRVWRVLEEFVPQQIHSLGISNCYKPKKFKWLYEQAQVKPKVLQNRFHDQTNFDIELRAMCKEYGTTYQSFWTLTANRNALASPAWKKIAKEKGLTSQTLMYAYMMTNGHTPLSGTKSSVHMEEDVDIMSRIQRGEKILDDKEVKTLSKLLGMR